MAEGQAGPNTSCTSSNHEGRGEGPNQTPRERGPVGGWGDAAGQCLDMEQEGVGTNHRAQEWPSDFWDKNISEKTGCNSDIEEKIGSQVTREDVKGLVTKTG